MQKILYTSPFVPPEWIAAHGFRPSRIVPDLSRRVEDLSPSEGMCHYMWQTVLEVNHDTDAAAAVFTTICDQMRRAPEFVDGRLSSSTFLFHVPKTWQSGGSTDYYISELERLGEFLSQLGGTAPSEDDLINVMLSYEEDRKSILSSRPLQPSKRFSQILNCFHAAQKVDLPESHTSLATNGIPVALVGGPLSLNDYSLFDVIESAGGAIVLDGTENGERTLPAPFEQKEIVQNPLRELARAYFEFIPDVFRRPNDGLFRWLQDAVEARSVRGVVLIRNVWCDLWHAEVYRIRGAVHVPLLDLDLDGGNAIGRNRTRIEAFVESLQ